jgi:hypothetical protein
MLSLLNLLYLAYSLSLWEFHNPNGVYLSFDESLPYHMAATIKNKFPAHDGIFCKFRLSPYRKLSNTINIAPVKPSMKGL